MNRRKLSAPELGQTPRKRVRFWKRRFTFEDLNINPQVQNPNFTRKLKLKIKKRNKFLFNTFQPCARSNKKSCTTRNHYKTPKNPPVTKKQNSSIGCSIQLRKSFQNLMNLRTVLNPISMLKIKKSYEMNSTPRISSKALTTNPSQKSRTRYQTLFQPIHVNGVKKIFVNVFKSKKSNKIKFL
ncbi:unnamed protein product [Moneuplotes crassus]|uniref:Uncharacterized protein n=1 Tax=Euplotes crassus TaxID=5936 RepID=A0AAD1X5B4_EUPCR|nr:unnamed protein product [Moneuplotes crassus]